MAREPNALSIRSTTVLIRFDEHPSHSAHVDGALCYFLRQIILTTAVLSPGIAHPASFSKALGHLTLTQGLPKGVRTYTAHAPTIAVAQHGSVSAAVRRINVSWTGWPLALRTMDF
ncbi:hypothetical protein ABHI18_009055 [Aspergillus niger]